MHIVKRISSFIKSHKIITSVIFIILVVLFFVFRPKPATPIATQKVEPTDVVQTVSVSGSVVAKNTAILTFPIGGTVSWVGVKTGDTVAAGQTIATLDQRTALKNLQQALTTYAIQRNTYDQTVADNGNTANPNTAVNDTEKRILETNQYNLDKAVNSVELQDLARQQSILTTPIAGLVTKADVTTAGTTAVLGTTGFTVVDPSSVVFSMDVDEADISKIRLGQTADITLDAYADKTLHLPINSIDFVSHTTSNGGNAFTVQVSLGSNSDYTYRVGMNGDADITTAKRVHVLAVTLSSIVNNNQVYVQQGKKFVKKTVVLGLQSDTEAEVISGLTAGELVVLDPTQVPKNQQ